MGDSVPGEVLGGEVELLEAVEAARENGARAEEREPVFFTESQIRSKSYRGTEKLPGLTDTDPFSGEDRDVEVSQLVEFD